MKPIIAPPLAAAVLLAAGCAGNKAQRQAELDAINAEYEARSQALGVEFRARMDAADPQDRRAVVEWYAEEQARLLDERHTETGGVTRP